MALIGHGRIGHEEVHQLADILAGQPYECIVAIGVSAFNAEIHESSRVKRYPHFSTTKVQDAICCKGHVESSLMLGAL